MKKILRNLFVFTLAIIICLPYSLNVKAAAIPQLSVITQPKAEYKPGERITFTVTSPNYTGKVQYRVMLYNGTTKKTSELWNTPKTGYYYTGWQPSGNYKFNITWIVKNMDPGAYSMTVLVRRVGAKVSYDSFVDTKSFYIISSSSGSNTGSGSGTGTGTGTNTDNNGTIKRVSIVDAKPSFDYTDKQKYGTLYYKRGIYLTETRTTQYGRYDTIHDNIMYLANNSTLPHIYYGDRDYTVCLGWQLAQINTEENLNQMQYSGLFDNNNSHNFEVYLYEVFYDSTTKQYYLANENHTELQGATIKKNVSNTVGTIPKYIAIPVQIVDSK